MTQVQLSPQQEQLLKIKQGAERKFELIKNEAIELSERCGKLQIADENTLSIGTQLLNSASDIVKKVEAKRKELKAPYVEAGKAIDTIAGMVTDPLDAAILTMKGKLKEWNTAQEAIRAEEQKKSDAKFQLLKQIEAQLDQKVKIAVTPESCQNLIDSINAKFPAAEKFEAFAQQALKIKASFINLLTIKKQSIEAALAGNAGEATRLANSVATAQAMKEEQSVELAEAKEEVKETIVATKSKTRKIWKFEVVDETKLPKQFLSFDEKKAREYMNANKEKWGKETIVGGVKFYEDEVPVA